jgi:hypothetical protein
MIELLSTVAITTSSLVLFAYWFRYTCLLMLSAKTAQDYAYDVAMAHHLSFLEIQSQLRESNVDFDRLRDALDRDYDLISHLLKSANASSLEDRMLAINYSMMRAWYRVSRGFSTSTACRALEEMSQVVAQFANTYGEQSTCPSAA